MNNSDLPSREDFDNVSKAQAEAKREAKRLTKLFREVFRSEKGKEVLEILSESFDLDVPSMILANFDPVTASFRDGQKAVLRLILDTIEGKQ